MIPFAAYGPVTASVLFSVRESSLPGKVIVILLFLGSIYVWTIMIQKYLELKRAGESSDLFEGKYQNGGNPLTVFLRKERYLESPLYHIYETACSSLGQEVEMDAGDPGELFTGTMPVQHRIPTRDLEGARNAAERSLAHVSLEMERTMPNLATAVTAAPFLGLLGTVWGVMDAFSSMALVGSASLSNVAPGIASALLTTVVGLLVALPSAIGYNLLISRIRYLQVRADNFSQQLVADFHRYLAADG